MALLLPNTPQKQLLVTGKWFPHVFVYTNGYIHICIQREIEERSKVKYKTRKKQWKYLFAVNLELINSLWVPNIFNKYKYKYKYIQTVKFLLSVNLELINSLWVPNIFIYNLKTFQVIDVLSKLAGPIKKTQDEDQPKKW